MEIKKILTSHPKEKPEEDKLVFGKNFSDHMFFMDYSEDKGWHNPTITPYGPLELDPAAMVLHYGQSVFEGMKCYSTNDGRYLLFRPEKNFARLNISDERLCIPHLDEEFLLEALIELLRIDVSWIPTSPGTSLYIRPFVFATEANVGVHSANQFKFVIILSPVGPYYPEGINPVKIYIEENYVRAVRGGTGFAKAAANYAVSLKGQEKAKKLGYSQVLWLDGIEKKYIEEVGAMNVFFKIDGKIVTPSLESGTILPGITRDSVITLLKDWDLEVEERKISVQELYEAYQKGKLEEVFCTGTAAVISPVGELNWEDQLMTIASGKTGPLTLKIYDHLTGIQYGRLPDKFDWTKEIKMEAIHKQ